MKGRCSYDCIQLTTSLHAIPQFPKHTDTLPQPKVTSMRLGLKPGAGHLLRPHELGPAGEQEAAESGRGPERPEDGAAEGDTGGLVEGPAADEGEAAAGGLKGLEGTVAPEELAGRELLDEQEGVLEGKTEEEMVEMATKASLLTAAEDAKRQTEEDEDVKAMEGRQLQQAIEASKVSGRCFDLYMHMCM